MDLSYLTLSSSISVSHLVLYSCHESPAVVDSSQHIHTGDVAKVGYWDIGDRMIYGSMIL